MFQNYQKNDDSNLFKIVIKKFISPYHKFAFLFHFLSYDRKKGLNKSKKKRTSLIFKVRLQSQQSVYLNRLPKVLPTEKEIR